MNFSSSPRTLYIVSENQGLAEEILVFNPSPQRYNLNLAVSSTFFHTFIAYTFGNLQRFCLKADVVVLWLALELSVSDNAPAGQGRATWNLVTFSQKETYNGRTTNFPLY